MHVLKDILEGSLKITLQEKKVVIAQAFCSQNSFWEITLNYAKLR